MTPMMYDAALRSTLFKGIGSDRLQELLASVPCRIRRFDKGEMVFRLMDTAKQVG